MADHTATEVLARLATLETTVRQQGAELAWHRQRRHRGRAARRALPMLLAALLVALVPLATLAANPFTDLTGGPHDGNIDAIFNTGITKGCSPTEYCPTANVTREEMASFLSRTAGLGGNPPIANALTAQTATNAQNALALGGQPASFYQSASQPIASAINAQNAATLGGYAPSALTRVASSIAAVNATLPANATRDIVQVTLTVPGPVAQVVYVRGAFNAYGQASGGNINTSIRQGGAPNTGGAGQLDFPYQTTLAYIGASVFAERTFIAPPGEHTFTLAAQTSDTAGTLTIAQQRLVATTHPFGNAGGVGTFDLPPDAPANGDKPRP